MTAMPVPVAPVMDPPRRSRTYRPTNSPDLASKPCMRSIRIDSRMPDHQVLEAGYFCRRLQHLDFAIFGLDSCESLGCGQNEFGSWNAPRSRAEVWQGEYGSTAVTLALHE